MRPQEDHAVYIIASLQAEVLKAWGPDGDFPQTVRSVQVNDLQVVSSKGQLVRYPKLVGFKFLQSGGCGQHIVNGQRIPARFIVVDGYIPQGGYHDMEITFVWDVPETEVHELGRELGRQMKLGDFYVHHLDCCEIDHTMAQGGYG